MRLFILLFLLSCGRSSVDGARVGETRTFNPIMASSEEKARLTTVCTALAAKAQTLSQSTGQVLRFDVSRKGCTEKSFGAAESVDVVIQKPSDRFLFKRKADNQDFVFTDVETDTTGVMGEICSQLSSLTNPTKLSDGSAVWISTLSSSSADCVASGSERCIAIERGSVVTSTDEAAPSYKVHTREWLKFQVQPTQTYYGYYTQRKSISTAFCAQNEELSTQVVLK